MFYSIFVAENIKGMPVFPATNEKNPKYDAYEKDIAILLG